jgi:salicylate hydroxylase
MLYVSIPDMKTTRTDISLPDIAHQSLPHNGAGAGQAIEDALLLSEIFKHPNCNADTAPEFLKVWEEIRRPRANKQMVHSRRSGDVSC